MTDIIQTCKKWYLAEIRVLKYLQPILLFLLRLYFGWMFMSAGLGKLSDPAAAAKQFAGLGVPLPTLNVYAAATVETVCGAILLVGAASRIVAIPLIFTMIVAYATAHREQVFDDPWGDPLGTATLFVKAPPFGYLLTALLVLLFGPGRLSLDGLLKWALDRRVCPTPAAGASAVPTDLGRPDGRAGVSPIRRVHE
jgi:putative oxidoreductase